MTNLLGLSHSFGSLSGGFGVVGLSLPYSVPARIRLSVANSRSEQIDSSSKGDCGFSANTLRHAMFLQSAGFID